MKLGFAIKVVSAGSCEPLSFNKGQWIKKVVDKRDYLKLFSGFIGTNNKLTFLSFEEDGCFLTILKSIPGRDGDHVSAWIYIPNTIDITGEQVVSVYNFASGILDETNISERQDEISNFFSTSFHEKERSVKNIPTNGEKFGIRFIDKEPLTELLGENRYQQYYSAYKAIFLLPQNEEKVVGSQFENLTGKPLRTYCILEAPTRSLLQTLGPNTTLYFEDGTLFDKDFTVAKESTIKLVAKRNGFNDVALDPFQVVLPVHKLELTRAITWNALITDAIFKIRNVDGEPVQNVTIEIGGQPLSFRGVLVPENKLQQTTFSIKAFDYEESTGFLPSNFQEIHVTLHKKIHYYGMRIVLANGSVAEFELKTRGSHDYKSDDFIKGYTYNTEYQAYDLDWWFVWKQRLLGMFAVLITLGVLAALGAWKGSVGFRWGSPPCQEIKKDSERIPGEDEHHSDDELSPEDSLAIKYLDSAEVWNKDSLDNYSITNGVYNDLNEFKFNSFEESYSKIIKASANMRKVSVAIQLSKERGIDPMIGKENNGRKYNRDNDKKIKISGYIEWITKNHNLDATPSQEEKSKSSTKASKIKDNSSTAPKYSSKTTEEKKTVTNSTESASKNTTTKERGGVQ